MRLLAARTEGEFKKLMWEHMKEHRARNREDELKKLMWEHMKEHRARNREDELKELMWEHMKEHRARNREGELKKLMWEHMKELAEEQSDETSRRKLSQDSSEDKVEEALPRVTETRNSTTAEIARVVSDYRLLWLHFCRDCEMIRPPPLMQGLK